MATVAKTQITNPLIVVAVKDFMKQNGFTQVHREVRVNTNGYPYITFINAKNEAENIYFSKGAADMPEASVGTQIGKGYFDNFNVATTTNEKGEERIKLVRTGSSTRLDIDDLF